MTRRISIHEREYQRDLKNQLLEATNPDDSLSDDIHRHFDAIWTGIDIPSGYLDRPEFHLRCNSEKCYGIRHTWLLPTGSPTKSNSSVSIVTMKAYIFSTNHYLLKLWFGVCPTCETVYYSTTTAMIPDIG